MKAYLFLPIITFFVSSAFADTPRISPGMVFSGPNLCPGQTGSVQVSIEATPGPSSSGPISVDATIGFELDKGKVRKPISGKYFPGHRKLVLYNAGPPMRPAEELTDRLVLEISSDGRTLNGAFEPASSDANSAICPVLKLAMDNTATDPRARNSNLSTNPVSPSSNGSANDSVSIREFDIFKLRPGMNSAVVMKNIPSWCASSRRGSAVECRWSPRSEQCDSIELGFLDQMQEERTRRPSPKRKAVEDRKAECNERFYASDSYRSRFSFSGITLPAVLLEFSGETLRQFKFKVGSPSDAEKAVSILSSSYGKPKVEVSSYKEPIYTTEYEHNPNYNPNRLGDVQALPRQVQTGERTVKEENLVWKTKDELTVIYSSRLGMIHVLIRNN